MASPVSNSNPASVTQQSTSGNCAPVSSGVSNVGSSMSSAAESQSEGFFACIAKPFVVALDAIRTFFYGLFCNDRADLSPSYHFQVLLNESISGGRNQPEVCLGDFLHLSKEKDKWKAFQLVQDKLSADQAKMFYDVLPEDMQNHLKRHIWEINGSDNNMGIFFGDAVIRDEIKGELVKKAIAKCAEESRS